MAQGMLTRIDENRIILLYKRDGLLRKIRILRPDTTLDSTEIVEHLNSYYQSASSVFATNDDIIIYDNGVVWFRGNEHRVKRIGDYSGLTITPNIPEKYDNQDDFYYIPGECIFDKKNFFTRKSAKYIEPWRYARKVPMPEDMDIRYITQPEVEVIIEE